MSIGIAPARGIRFRPIAAVDLRAQLLIAPAAVRASAGILSLDQALHYIDTQYSSM